MFIGLFLLIIVSFIARWLNMNALNWILSSLKTVWVVAFVILSSSPSFAGRYRSSARTASSAISSRWRNRAR